VRAGLLASVAVTAAATLDTGLTWTLLEPRPRELAVMSVALIGTGLAGLGAALAARPGLPRLALRWQIVVASCTGLILLVLNVAVAAWLMFLSTHDLQLLLVLCAFGLAASMPPALLLSEPLTRRVLAVQAAATDVASGNFARRTPVDGTDEVASLSRAFNDMAQALDLLEKRRAADESSRRALYAAISHDLRTPLSTMRAMVEAMADGVVTDQATCARYLRAVSSEIDHLTSLINDLFELTRIESGELQLRIEALDLTAVLGNAVESFRPQLESARIELRLDAVPRTAVRADPDRLTRVVYNLLHNALRHTPHDGTILLRSERMDDGWVQVAVSDSGEGIAAEDVPFVFDRFFRGNRSRTRDGSGSGLGLSIARGIVESHGGRIWIEHSSGTGTTITFTIPGLAGTRVR
jgi:signal transduction histidine kinase